MGKENNYYVQESVVLLAFLLAAIHDASVINTYT
jgi:hypothetical protein